MVTFDDVRKIALSLPAVEEGTSYGTPAFKVRGKFMARLREDDTTPVGSEAHLLRTLVVRVGCDYKEMYLRDDPQVFYTTDHYNGYPAILIRMEAARDEQVREAFEQAWRLQAPKKLLAEFDHGTGPSVAVPNRTAGRPSG